MHTFTMPHLVAIQLVAMLSNRNLDTALGIIKLAAIITTSTSKFVLRWDTCFDTCQVWQMVPVTPNSPDISKSAQVQAPTDISSAGARSWVTFGDQRRTNTHYSIKCPHNVCVCVCILVTDFGMLKLLERGEKKRFPFGFLSHVRKKKWATYCAASTF